MRSTWVFCVGGVASQGQVRSHLSNRSCLSHAVYRLGEARRAENQVGASCFCEGAERHDREVVASVVRLKEQCRVINSHQTRGATTITPMDVDDQLGQPERYRAGSSDSRQANQENQANTQLLVPCHMQTPYHPLG